MVTFVTIPRLNVPTLSQGNAIVTGQGTPSNAFQRYWQNLVRALTGTTDAIILNQELLQAQSDYLTASAAWQVELGDFLTQNLTYLQLAVAIIATDTGTDISGAGDPGALPDYPGPPPSPPS